MSGVVKPQDKADIIADKLQTLYPEIPIPLDHTNAFELLVAVLMSAQTTDLKVNQVTPALFAKASNPEAMAALEVETILADIRQVGLAPTKAKNIRALSETLVSEHQSVVPPDIDALEALPGVGHKTASVVMAQAFGVPAFPVDTHIHRLAQRWGLTNGKNVIETEKDLKKLFPKKNWNKLHLQIIYYGREYCKARECHGLSCKICTTCYPTRKKPLITKKA